MKNKNVRSILESVCTQVWAEPNLNRAKEIVITKVTNSNINDDSKDVIINTVNGIYSKNKLDSYIANSMMAFEGLRTR